MVEQSSRLRVSFLEIYSNVTLFPNLGLDQATQHIQKMLSEMNACIECFLNKHQQKDEGINWFLEACKEGLSARFLTLMFINIY